MPAGIGLAYKYLIKARRYYKDKKSLSVKALDGIEYMEEQDILSRLPFYFGYDIQNFLNANPEKKLVVFIDTYEALWENTLIKNPLIASETDAWVRDLVASTPGVLFVFFSRNNITWDKTYPDEWNGYLADQYPIGSLSQKFANEYLKCIPIKSQSIRDIIINAAQGHPFFLELEAENYIDIKNSGREPQEKDFGGTKQNILSRFRRYRSPSEIETLKMLSIPQWFNKNSFEYIVKEFNTSFPLTAFISFMELSIFTKDSEGGIRIHNLMRTHLLEDLKEDQDLFESSCKVLFKYFDLKSQPSGDISVLTSHELAFEQAYILLDKTNPDISLNWILERARPFFSPARFHWLKPYIEQTYHEAKKAKLIDLQLQSLRLLLEILFITGKFDSVKNLCEENICLAQKKQLCFEEVELEFQYARSMLELGEIEQSIAANRHAYHRLETIKSAGFNSDEENTLHKLDLQIVKSLAFSLSLKGDIDETIQLGKVAIKKADDFNMLNEMISRRAYLALYLSYTGNLEASETMYKEALKKAIELDPKEQFKYTLALTYGLFSEFSLINKNFKQSEIYSKKALEFDSAINNPISGSWCNWLLALSYAYQHKLELSLKHAEIACLFDRPLNNPNPNVLLGILLLRLNRMSKGLEKLEETIAYIDNKLLNKCDKNWEATFAKALALLGLTQKDQSNLDKALICYRKGKVITPNSGHLLRLQIQTSIVQPLLSKDDWQKIQDAITI
jgi:tetratricopeptide (TPR) repeat protein